jgi:hypothetical protein
MVCLTRGHSYPDSQTALSPGYACHTPSNGGKGAVTDQRLPLCVQPAHERPQQRWARQRVLGCRSDGGGCRRRIAVERRHEQLAAGGAAAAAACTRGAAGKLPVMPRRQTASHQGFCVVNSMPLASGFLHCRAWQVPLMCDRCTAVQLQTCSSPGAHSWGELALLIWNADTPVLERCAPSALQRQRQSEAAHQAAEPPDRGQGAGSGTAQDLQVVPSPAGQPCTAWAMGSYPSCTIIL